MHAIEYRFSLTRLLAARLAARWRRRRNQLALGSVRLREQGEAALPGEGWLRLRPIYSGICGSDLALLTGQGSPALSPFLSFPCVPGHEVVGEVIEAGSAVEIKPGAIIAVDPFLSCAVRGLDPCPSCRRGATSLCWNVTEGAWAPGMLLGFCRDLPGGWSRSMLVHQSQAYPLPENLAPEKGVLIEPLSIGLHAVLQNPPPPGGRVLIIGAGAIGLCVLAALRLLGIPAEVTVAGRHAYQLDAARLLGADHVIQDGPEGGAGRAAREIAGARELRPLMGRTVYVGGFERVYDAVGSRGSLDDALRVTAPLGEVVLVGCAGLIRSLDWSFVWSRELRIRGCYGYGKESREGASAHTFEIAIQLLQENPSCPIEQLITHRFPLTGYRQALESALDHARARSIKTVLDCRL